MKANRKGLLIIEEAATLKNWQFMFKEKHGMDNKEKVVKAFFHFMEDYRYNELVVPGECMLCGEIFNSKRFNEGESILTSYVLKIRKVDRAIYPTHTFFYQMQNAATDKNLLFVETENSNYFLEYDKKSAWMFMMLDDLQRKHKLNNDGKKYMPSKFSTSILL